MSSSKSVKKSSSLFNLDNVDNLVRSSSKKIEKEAGPSLNKPYFPRLKSIAKRTRTVEAETEIPSLKKRILELVEEIPDFERQAADHKRHVAELREAIFMRDDLIKELKRENGEVAANRALAEIEHNEKMAKAIEEVSRDASKTILTSRIKMAKEAGDAAFNRAEWDIAGWQKALDELEIGMYLDDDDDLALIEVGGTGAAEGIGGKK